MRRPLRSILTKRLQKVFWIYLTDNFIITSISDLKTTELVTRYTFTPITYSNYFRVKDFREEERIREYRDKLAHKEMGFFAELDGKMVGSIWATINNACVPVVARSYMRLMPSEALIHDIVTSERFRGMGIGSFMVGAIASALFNEYRSSRIIIDVNFRNSPSLRMMNRRGLQVKQRAIYISILGRCAFQKVLKQYP